METELMLVFLVDKTTAKWCCIARPAKWRCNAATEIAAPETSAIGEENASVFKIPFQISEEEFVTTLNHLICHELPPLHNNNYNKKNDLFVHIVRYTSNCSMINVCLT